MDSNEQVAPELLPMVNGTPTCKIHGPRYETYCTVCSLTAALAKQAAVGVCDNCGARTLLDDSEVVTVKQGSPPSDAPLNWRKIASFRTAVVNLLSVMNPIDWSFVFSAPNNGPHNAERIKKAVQWVERECQGWNNAPSPPADTVERAREIVKAWMATPNAMINAGYEEQDDLADRISAALVEKDAEIERLKEGRNKLLDAAEERVAAIDEYHSDQTKSSLRCGLADDALRLVVEAARTSEKGT